MPVPAQVVQGNRNVEDLHLLIHVDDGVCATLLNHHEGAAERQLVAGGGTWELPHGAPEDGAALDALPIPWNSVIWTGGEATLKRGPTLHPLRGAVGLLPPSIEELTKTALSDYGAKDRAERLAAAETKRH